MRKIYIKYDPYEMKSTVIVDGKEVQKNKHCDSNLKRYLDSNVHLPIQSWIDPIDRDNWKGLLDTLCQMGDKDIVVEFAGREVDYESVKASLNAQNHNRNCGAKLTFCDLTNTIIPDSQMKENIAEVIKLMLTEEFEKIVAESESKELIEKYGHLKETYDEIEAEEFRIVFTGTYSSGKSSTINALMGKNILPTASGTCTAKICRIIHSDVKNGIAIVRYLRKGKKEEFLCRTETDVQEKIQGAEEAVETIEVYTDLSNLYPAGVQNDFNLVLIDTPGTDSATGNDTKKTAEESKRLSKKSHIEITKEVLKSKQKEMVVFISDDKLEDDNIVELLDIIEESADRDDGAFNDRFLFVMNMCDSLTYSNKGETLDNYIRNFVANIKKVPNSSRVRNIVNPRIFPITSGAALAIVNGFTEKPGIAEGMSKKAELYGYYKEFCQKVYYYEPAELNCNFEQYKEQIKTQYQNYGNYCLERKSSVSEAVKYEYIVKLEGDLTVPERVFIHSGIPALESAIHDYIRSYAYPIKVRQLLNCFTDILEELNSLNVAEMEALQSAKKDYSGAVSLREKTEQEKEEEEERKNRLLSVKGKMERVKRKVSDIRETIPEINGIRSEFFTIKSSIADEVGSKREVLKEEGDIIIGNISVRMDQLLGKINDMVRDVKNKKKEATGKLYDEFLGYLEELESEGLMQNGRFSFHDTVAYKKLIDKDNFAKPVEDTRTVSNPRKQHIEFGYGIGNFFDSIGRAWKTRNEPQTIQKTYINIGKYIDENINPLQAEIDKYVEKLKSDYKNDIVYLKTETEKRVDSVIELIEKKDQEISRIRTEAYRFAADERQYSIQIEKLEQTRKYLDLLILKLGYTQV
jgi:GTPase SAR1 family protein|nr:dynamin family protein [uncultured Acetatifactor sp.]